MRHPQAGSRRAARRTRRRPLHAEPRRRRRALLLRTGRGWLARAHPCRTSQRSARPRTRRRLGSPPPERHAIREARGSTTPHRGIQLRKQGHRRWRSRNRRPRRHTPWPLGRRHAAETGSRRGARQAAPQSEGRVVGGRTGRPTQRRWPGTATQYPTKASVETVRRTVKGRTADHARQDSTAAFSRPPAPRRAARPRAPAGRSPHGGCGGWRPPRAGTCARGPSRRRARRCRAPAAPARSAC